MMPIAKDLNIQVDQLNVLEFQDAWNIYNITKTPTMIYIEDGKEVARLEGDDRTTLHVNSLTMLC